MCVWGRGWNEGEGCVSGVEGCVCGEGVCGCVCGGGEGVWGDDLVVTVNWGVPRHPIKALMSP